MAGSMVSGQYEQLQVVVPRDAIPSIDKPTLQPTRQMTPENHPGRDSRDTFASHALTNDGSFYIQCAA
jgi:hypothetical protein